MEANDRLIVNLFNNESFTLCKIDEVDASIKFAQEFYANDVETYKHHLIYFPNMSDHWQKQLEICESVLKAGFEAITWEEYVKRQREKWLSKEPKEQKVYLIVQDKPFGKVFARVFGSQEKAEKAMNERDERTGEKLYPDCHIIERTIE